MVFRSLFSIFDSDLIIDGFLHVNAVQGTFNTEKALSRGHIHDCENFAFADIRFKLYTEYHRRVQRLGWDTGAAILDNTEQSRPRRSRTARGKTVR